MCKMYWDVSSCIISHFYIHCLILPGICFATNNVSGCIFIFSLSFLTLCLQRIICAPPPKSSVDDIKFVHSYYLLWLLNDSETSEGFSWPAPVFFFFFFFFSFSPLSPFFLFASSYSIWKFPRQGSNPSQRCNLHHSSSNSGSLTPVLSQGSKPSLHRDNTGVLTHSSITLYTTCITFVIVCAVAHASLSNSFVII